MRFNLPKPTAGQAAVIVAILSLLQSQLNRFTLARHSERLERQDATNAVVAAHHEAQKSLDYALHSTNFVDKYLTVKPAAQPKE